MPLPMAESPARTVSTPQRTLIDALRDPRCYPHPAGTIRVVETHISWVMLTGDFAYKIKKPVNLGFLDFTSLDWRRHYCEEELRLNRRLAPELYLEVVEIRGAPDAPRVGGDGPLLDYAVKMREFPQDALAARLIERGKFGAADVDALAQCVARFHAAAPVASSNERFGSAGTVLKPALANFRQMMPLLRQARDKAALHALEQWTGREFEPRRAAFEARRRRGFVRECHGDLHLGNIAVIDGKPVPFDCIEFNDELRWIDVMSEVAFLFMDLVDRARPDLAWRFLDRYLASSGDHGGLEVFRFYLVYRALVRAKIHLLRSLQPHQLVSTRSRLKLACNGYVRLAERHSRPPAPSLIITHGLSGSGKTTATQSLIELLGAVRLRSDLERKRLQGLAPLSSSGSTLAGGIYAPDSTAATYRRLGELAREALRAGYPVVVDATFLKRAEREALRAIAGELDAPFLILDFRSPLEVLRARVVARRKRADDASEADPAVLEYQISAREPLTPAELAATVAVDATEPVSHQTWRPVMDRLRRTAASIAPVPPSRTA